MKVCFKIALANKINGEIRPSGSNGRARRLATDVFESSLNLAMSAYLLKINTSSRGSHRTPKEAVSSFSKRSLSSMSRAGARSSSGIRFKSSGEFVAHL